MRGERIDLRLVEMRDRLDVGGAVAVLHEETLVVFEPVRRAEHGVVQPVGVIIFELLSRPLLHVGRGDDAEIDVERHADGLPLAGRRLHDELRDVVGAACESTTLQPQPAPNSGTSRRMNSSRRW